MKLAEQFKEKLKMYDTIIANFLANNHVILDEKHLDSKSLVVGFNNLETEQYVTKYYAIHSLPMYLPNQWFSKVRRECAINGIRVDFYFYSEPHYIQWDSPEMINRLKIWREAIDNTEYSDSVFDFRSDFNDRNNRDAIMRSTLYLNQAELEFKRTTSKVSFVIAITSKKDQDSLDDLNDSLKHLKSICRSDDVRLREIKVNVLDWINQISPFSLRKTREVSNLFAKRIMTDDVLANFSSYKQGRMGQKGVSLGIDLYSSVPVLKKFKESPDEPENILIAAETGGGKSYYVKTLISYLMADNCVVTVMDYEGDEYTNYANFIKAGNEEDVKIISMGKGSAIYFDPMEIADLTGDVYVDADLKETAMAYTLAIFRLLVAGIDGQLTQWEERVISTAIKNMYNRRGVTDDPSTWARSKGMRIRQVYLELKRLRDNHELVDAVDLDKLKHKAAVKIVDALAIYFEPGESKAGTFANPMSVNELYRAKFIIFQFGMKGTTSSQVDPVILALKQLSVANVSIQISNHCKYVRKCYNVKVWEEFQRWGEIRGSSEIIINAITGGRKRGDINLLITNNLSGLLDSSNLVSMALAQNFTGKIVGGIADKVTRDEFCDRFNVPEIATILERIALANRQKTNSNRQRNNRMSKYKHAFCVMMGEDKAVVKVKLPPALANSKIFRTGIDTDNTLKDDI